MITFATERVVRVDPKTALLLGCFTSLVGCGTAPVLHQSDSTSVAVETSDWHRGNVRFTCHLACAFAFGANRDRLRQLHEAQMWLELRSEVLRLQFDQDLSYYYLGRAAEGLGYLDGARSYYVRSMHAQYHCDDAFNLCNGLNLRKTLSDRLVSIQQAQGAPPPIPAPAASVAPSAAPLTRTAQATVTSAEVSPAAAPSVLPSSPRQAATQPSSAASQVSSDKRTPAERYQGAYLGAWLICALNQKIMFKVDEAKRNNIKLRDDLQPRESMDTCIARGLLEMKNEYASLQKLVKGADGRRALEEHYVGAIMHVRQTPSRPRETEETYTERMNETKRKTDELWVRFEITQP